MAKNVLEAALEWQSGGCFMARIEVGADGWGKVFDKTDGLYCGSLNPLRTRQLMRGACLC